MADEPGSEVYGELPRTGSEFDAAYRRLLAVARSRPAGAGVSPALSDALAVLLRTSSEAGDAEQRAARAELGRAEIRRIAESVDDPEVREAILGLLPALDQ